MSALDTDTARLLSVVHEAASEKLEKEEAGEEVEVVSALKEDPIWKDLCQAIAWVIFTPRSTRSCASGLCSSW